MQLTGTIKQVLPSQSGEGRNGQWKKDFLLMSYTSNNYDKSVVLMLWNYDGVLPTTGQEVTAHFDPESREYNGRWYTDCKCWRIDIQAA